MKMTRFPLLAATLGLVLSAHTCQTKDGAQGDAKGQLEGKWVLAELNGKTASMPEGKEMPYLMIDSLAQQVNGFAGCNRMFGPMRVWGDSISFAHLAATRMYCVETQAMEDEFMKALNEARTYLFRDGEIILRNNADLMVLRKAQ